MNLRPGCGCLALLLALANFLLFFLTMYSFVIGGATESYLCPYCGEEFSVTKTTGVLGLLMALIFLASGVVTLTIGWASLRMRRRIMASLPTSEEEGVEDEEEYEGMEEEE